MRNRIDIDHTHSRAIVREIGERLRGFLTEETELPSNLKGQMERLRAMDDDESPSIVPGEDDFRSKPRPDDSKGQARHTSRWRRNG